MTQARDPLVVKTEQLSFWLTRWAEKFDKEHPSNRSFNKPNVVNGYGALRFLAEEMGADPDHYSKSREYRLLVKVKRRDTKLTAYAIADEILTAMEEIFRLGSDIEVLPNPRVKRQPLH